MKKLNFMLATLALLLWAGGARADVVSNYKMDFNTAFSTDKSDFKVASGWGHVVDYYYDSENWKAYYPEYTYKADGGVDNSGCLLVDTQTSLGDPWSEGGVGSSVDLLVTPKVTGASSIYVKKNKNGGRVMFYTVTKTGTNYTKGLSIKTVSSSELSTDEFVKVDIPEQNGAYIGIYGSDVYFDDFEAASIEYTLTKALTISKVDVKTNASVDCDTEGKFTVAMDVTVTNSGDVDLAPGDENYSVSIVNNSKNYTVVATKAIDVALAKGESTTVSLSGTDVYDKAKAYCRYDARENLTKTTAMGAWIEAVPYLPEIDLRNADKDKLESGDDAAQAFGMVSEPATRKFTIKNTGAAPMEITAITLPEGFSSDLVAPLTIAAHKDTTWNLSFSATVPGVYSGDVVLSIKGIDDFKMPVSGTILDTAKYFVNFEDGKMPAGTIEEGGEEWSIYHLNSDDNKYCLENGNSTNPTKFILPLLKVGEGEKMTIDVARRSNYSFLNVYYSDNRKDWTLAKEITYTDLPSDKISGSWSNYKFKTFVIDSIPAGNKYIVLESGFARVDNIYGFELVDVAHDMMVSKFDVPLTQTVNSEVTVTAEVTNVHAAAVEAGSYTATLYVDGKAVSTADAVAVPSGETAAFAFVYTPHADGTFKTYAEFKFADGYTATSDTVTVTVEKETANQVVTVGTKTETNQYVPLAVFYKNSETEIVYTADKLAGIADGAAISGVVFKGENNYGNDTKRVTVWVANTEDDACTSKSNVLSDTTVLVKVYEGDYTFVKGETNLLSVTFAEPFKYTGKNIRMVLRSTSKSYKRCYFEVDESDKTHCMSRHLDSDITTATFNAYALPVANFMVKREPSTVEGTVIKVDGKPVADAKVTLTSGNVIYTATTDAEGSYAATVFQNDKTYTMTLEGDGQTKTKENVSFAGGDVTADFILGGQLSFKAGQKSTLILNEAPDATLGSYYALAKVEGTTVTFIKESAPKADVPYVFVAKADCDVTVDEVPETEAGATTVGDVTFQGSYGVKSLVSDAAVTYYGFKAADGTFVQVGTTKGAKVNPMHAYLAVPAAAGAKAFRFVFDDNTPTGISGTTADKTAKAELYDLNGRRVDTLRAAKGLYIKNGKKVIVK